MQISIWCTSDNRDRLGASATQQGRGGEADGATAVATSLIGRLVWLVRSVLLVEAKPPKAARSGHRRGP